MSTIKNPLFIRLTLIIGSIVAGFLLCLVISYYHPFFAGPAPRSLRLTENEYPLISPLLICNANQVNLTEDTTLKEKLNTYIQTNVNQGNAEKVSVYALEYGTGSYFGINEDDQYDPASLLKVPLMIAYYQLAEKDPALLTQTTSFVGDDQNTGEFYKSPNDIRPQTLYTIDDLIKSMIVNSDNSAAVLLTNYVDKSSLAQVYSDLGLSVPLNDPTIQSLSAKSYAYFFRVLYNATYLDHADSEKALKLLSETDFNKGLESGIPTGVTVAEKFGERSIYDQNHTLVDRELHDCGIVYKPESPYLLCIMTQGKDFAQLDSVIRGISTLVYTSIGQK